MLFSPITFEQVKMFQNFWSGVYYSHDHYAKNVKHMMTCERYVISAKQISTWAAWRCDG